MHIQIIDEKGEKVKVKCGSGYVLDQ